MNADLLTIEKPSDRQWPTSAVVDEARRDPNWRSLPFTEFIVKIHGRCNLSCDYCYMYEMADQSWRNKRVVMDRATFDQVANRIAEHLQVHDDLTAVQVIFHGGEPLLAGADFLDYASTRVRQAAPAGSRVELAIQTNGLLLSSDVLGVLDRHDIKVGVSLDGGQQAHDRHRRFAHGGGSYQGVTAGLAALRQPPYRRLFGGLLCTIDVANDPVQVYNDLAEQDPPIIDFLLPHGNWTQPPPAWAGPGNGTPYADWLIPIFDTWYPATPMRTRIRIFEEIMSLVLGGHAHTEAVGLTPMRLIVVETDGSLEAVDTLKSSFDGAPETGITVFSDPFDAAMMHPQVVARQRGVAALCPTCNICPIRDICGGGNYTHRYREGSGFLNPSVYCADLQKLIGHISARVHRDLHTSKESS